MIMKNDDSSTWAVFYLYIFIYIISIYFQWRVVHRIETRYVKRTSYPNLCSQKDIYIVQGIQGEER